MVLRYFAGDDPLDKTWIHNVNENEPFRSVWFVVDTIHAIKSINIVSTLQHQEKLVVAAD